MNGKSRSAISTPVLTWNSDALLSKAQRYVEEMLELQRDDWRFCFWSSLSLELLSRAALARISPALLADPEDWNNLYNALGHEPKANKFIPKSITITEVLKRLKLILPEFDTELENFCKLHIVRRNAELHTGEMPFDGIKNSSWLPTFYRSCAVLLDSMGSDLSQFVGDDEFKVAEKLIAAAAADAANAIASDIKSYKTVWLAKSKDERSELSSQASLWARKHVGHRVICPACGSKAIVTGEPISAPMKSIKDDIITEIQQYLPDKFECIACGMRISGLSYLSAAGLGDAYKQTQKYDAAEYYAPDDEMEGWEPDNNEPF